MTAKLKSAGLWLGASACLVLAATMGAHSRDDRALPASMAMGSDAPPGVRFVTVALGGFRGLLADVLWGRASTLQDQGRFFEVAQLAGWITRLEPRYPEVWSYHAWNMAYNITAVVPDPADRWHWVENGIRLLRDEGIPSNPYDPKLRWELAWMFYDKVGGRWDEATLFYRVSWAREFSRLTGERGRVDHDALARHPETVPLFTAAGLSPSVMRALDETYGPFDWRLPETHALYWGGSGRSLPQPDARWCERMVWMALTASLEGGYLAYLPDKRLYLQGCRPDIAIRGVRRCQEENPFRDPLAGMAATRFLREAIVILYAFGRPDEAVMALEALRRVPGGDTVVPSLEEFIQREAGHAAMLAAESRPDRIRSLLKRGQLWQRLGIPEQWAGLERLARLCWEALPERDRSAFPWETLMQEAGQEARRDLP